MIVFPLENAHPSRSYSCLTLISIVLILSACGTTRYTSHWDGTSVQIDGDPGEWHRYLTPVAGKGMSIGFVNDAENLYFCTVTTDRQLQRTIFFRGLNLWLDSGGGKTKMYGIRYPLGMTGLKPAVRREIVQEMRNRSEQGIQPAQDRQQLLEQMLKEFTLMGDKSVGEDFPFRGEIPVQVRESVRNNERGIELQVNRSGAGLIYEGKIPLGEFCEDEAKISGIIGLGLEIPEFQRPSRSPVGGVQNRRPGDGIEPPAGGLTGRGPGRMGGRGTAMRPGTMSPAEPFEFWSKVKLMQSPATDTPTTD